MVQEGKSTKIFRQLRDHLSSLKLTISLLLILAVVSIFGTVIPQNASPQEYLQFYKLPTYKILKILGLLDMYHAPWFFFLLGLLSLNLIFCSWKRFKSTWKILTSSIPQDESSWQKLSPRGLFLTGANEGEILMKIKKVFAQFYPPLKIQRVQHILFLSTEKGKFSHWGVYFIHLSILIILTGALIGFYTGFRGHLNIKEGERADRIFLKNGQEIFFPDFSIHLENFSVSYYPTGVPREFKSVISIFENGQKILTAPILVNQPLTYKGITFYQASYGIVDFKKVILDIEDSNSGRKFTLPAFLDKENKIPENSWSIRLNRFIPDFQGFGPALQINISDFQGSIENFLVLLNHPDFSAGEKTKRFRVRVKEWTPIYFSGLQVTKDPGVGIVWLGCALMIVGFYLTFFNTHRRLWMKLYEARNGFFLEIVLFRNRDRQNLEKELKELERSLRDELSISTSGQKAKGEV
ncbi:MAG: cytochrome c biogenesis protein ResB [bacterium]